MANIRKLVPGQKVYDLQRHKMGDTTITTTSVYTVTIVEVGDDTVSASWNGNPARTYFRRAISKWKTTKPTLVKIRGYACLATPKEKAAAEAAGLVTEHSDCFVVPSMTEGWVSVIRRI